MTKLREYGIVTQAMRGQGYDGAANMAGKFSGVRTRIQTEIPEAYPKSGNVGHGFILAYFGP
jgi:hypothetical protein